jgi:RNA polymerase sigma-70 factor (ECF subfamily)
LEISVVEQDSLWDAMAIEPDVLQDALNELPDEYRLVVLMFFFDEISYKEIAQQLGVPIGTVMSRLSRAKARLRERLGGEPGARKSVPSRPRVRVN